MSLYTRGRALADTLQNFVTGLGTQKDPRTSTQFSFRELDRYTLERMYRGDWMARRLVDLPAEDATREWRQWTGDRAKLEKIDQLERKLEIQKKTRQALQRARLYGGAALVFGVDQGQPEDELDLDKVGLNDLKFVVVCNRYELSAGPRIFNVDSQWYTRPEYYTVSTPMFGFYGEAGGPWPVDPKLATAPPIAQPPLPDKGRQVQPSYGMVRMHPSRVIEFTGNELPDWRLAPLGGGWGDSILQTVDDALRDFAMIVSGLASLINDMKMDVVKVPDLSRKLSTDDITRRTLERFGLANLAKSSINTLLLDKEEEWDRITTSFGSTPELIKVSMTLACAAGGVPESRIMGNAPNKGLASQGNSGGEVDIRNYYDDIASKQNSQYKPMMRPLDRCIQQSALGRYDPSIDYDWNPLYQPTSQELAQVALAKAQTTQVYVSTGLINEDALREAVVSQLTEDKLYPGLEDAIDEFGSEPEEPPAPLQPMPPNAPPGMVPKGQFEANPFHMLRAQTQAQKGQPIRVPPNRKPGPTQYEKVPPGAQGAQKPNGGKKPFQKDGLIWDFGDPDELRDEDIVAISEGIESYLRDRGVEDFNPYHDPETGRFISGEEGRKQVHAAGTKAVAAALGARQRVTPGEAAAAEAMHGGGDDVRALALKLAPVHHFLATPAVHRSIAKVVGHYVAQHTVGLAGEAVHHSLNVGVEGALDYMIGTVAAHAAAGVAATAAVPHVAVAIAAGYGVHILLGKAEKHGFTVENARHLLGKALHYLADHYHALKRGVADAPDDEERGDAVLAAIRALLPHFPRGDDGGLVDFNPYHDPQTGEFTTGEGGAFLATSGGGGGNYGLIPGDVEKFHGLKDQWAQINNHLLTFVDRPDSPEAQADMSRLEKIVKDIHALHADPGTPEGIGLPGGPRDVTIVGAGPGGLAASIFGGAEGLDTLVVESNAVAGGQARYSSRIENFPGFPIGVTGENLTKNMFDQAARLGAEAKLGVRVTSMTYDEKTGLKHLTLANGEKIDSRAVILAGGVEFRRPTFPGADGPGVIVGDGKTLADQSVGGDAVVIGGSNGAAQAALGAAVRAKHVYLISRSAITKGMSDYQVEAVHNQPKITVIENDSVAKVDRDVAGNMQGVETAKGQKFPSNALGVFLGSVPETGWLAGKVERDEGGRIATDAKLETKMPGVFAVGDMRHNAIGRVGVAVGEGQLALREAHVYLEGLKHRPTADGLPVFDEESTEDLITRLFALDRENPWLGSTIEGVKPGRGGRRS